MPKHDQMPLRSWLSSFLQQKNFSIFPGLGVKHQVSRVSNIESCHGGNDICPHAPSSPKGETNQRTVDCRGTKGIRQSTCDTTIVRWVLRIFGYTFRCRNNDDNNLTTINSFAMQYHRSNYRSIRIDKHNFVSQEAQLDLLIDLENIMQKLRENQISIAEAQQLLIKKFSSLN